jgi:predicted ATP-dependent serine protease
VATSSGAGTVLHVFGEPGVGKSRLLLELQRQLVIQGVRVLTGHATQQPLALRQLPTLRAGTPSEA